MRGLALLCWTTSPFTLPFHSNICSNVSNIIRTIWTKPLSGNAIISLRIILRERREDMRKIGVALLCGLLLTGLAGCGSQPQESKEVKSAPNTASSTAESSLTDKDLKSAFSECSSESKPGADMLAEQENSRGYVISLTSFLDSYQSEGIDSDAAQCVFNSLSINNSETNQFRIPTATEQRSTIHGINTAWTNQDGVLAIYMSAESLDQ